MDEYALVKNADQELTFRSGYSTYLAFDLQYTRVEDEWKITAIRLPSQDEELIPGMGIGTQGMNGVTDEMISTISGSSYDQRIEQYIQCYLRQYGMENIQVINPD